MLQNSRKTLGFKKNMVYKIPPGGGGKPYPASGHGSFIFYIKENIKLLHCGQLTINAARLEYNPDPQLTNPRQRALHPQTAPIPYQNLTFTQPYQPLHLLNQSCDPLIQPNHKLTCPSETHLPNPEFRLSNHFNKRT